MCDPVSLTIAATTVAAGGALYGGYVQKQEAKYNSAVASNNATMERQAAEDALKRGNVEEAKHWRQVAALRAQQTAAFAANGFDTGFGSAADIVGDTDYLGAVDAQAIRENTEREARAFNLSAQNFTEEAKAQRRAGNNAMIAATIDATGTVLSGASQIRGMKTPAPKARTSAAPSRISAPSWASPAPSGGRVTVY